MELVDNEEVETMVALYYRNQSSHTEPIQLFAELADVEPTEDFIPLNEEHGVQDLCTKVSRASVDRWLLVCGFNINLNVPPASENLILGPHLQIHQVVIEIDANGEDGYDNNDHSNLEVEDYNDLDLDEVSDDIDDECVNDNENVHTPSIGNLSRGIEDYVFAIKRYGMNMSIDYKVVMSKPTLYIEECWRSIEGYNWQNMSIIPVSVLIVEMNQNLLTVVFVIVESENMEPRKFFLMNLQSRDPFTASDISTPTSTKTTIMQTGGNKL
ncbi:hypothetical protein GOBAR_DD15201 [Gossypium barbadense]|nr:hypothetical protein GOBAR_DD15201 [Gossypium barbadense]